MASPRVPRKTTRQGGATGARADAVAQYERVLGPVEKKRARVALEVDRDVVELVERAVEETTRQVRELYAAPLVERATACGACRRGEVHYHGAILYEGGKERF